MTRPYSYRSIVLLLLVSWQANGHAAELVDPTRPITAQAPAATKVAESGPLKLEGIVHSVRHEVAIVNGRLVHAGDWVGNARIDFIAHDRLIYSRAGHTQVLKLSTPIKVRHSATVREEK